MYSALPDRNHQLCLRHAVYLRSVKGDAKSFFSLPSNNIRLREKIHNVFFVHATIPLISEG